MKYRTSLGYRAMAKTERDDLELAIANIEVSRATLGDAAAELALAAFRKRLAELENHEDPARSPTTTMLLGERKIVTVLFADVSGFTALSEKKDPESVRDIMNGCFERLVPIVGKYGGTVDKFIGDEIMALFGAPLTHENDPERALRTALEMVESLEKFNTAHGLSLGLHFGVNTGQVIAGGIGSGARKDYSVMGDAVNVAARLEDKSERGEILVGQDTYRLTEPLFVFQEITPFRVKGKAEPIRVYRLLGLKAEPGPVRGLASHNIKSPLVGRDGELDALKTLIHQALNGQGALVSVIGEAGLGKSRLIAEARAYALGKGPAVTNGAVDFTFAALPATVSGRRPFDSGAQSQILWLEGHGLSFGSTISYLPFQEILCRYAGVSDDDTDTRKWNRLEESVKALFQEATPEILPYLASLLALDVSPEYAERVKYLDGEAMRRQVFVASRRFFERLTASQAVVLVFEDMHWVDKSSALLIEHLMPLTESARLLIVGVSRPDPESPGELFRQAAAAAHPELHTEIRLSPLSRKESLELILNLVEIESLPPHVREVIAGKAEGNPFFMEETVRSLIDAGKVVRDRVTGRWRAVKDFGSIAIPDTIHGVIMARVDRLDEEVKNVLRTASVIGRSFWYRVLHAVSDADRKLDKHLAELQAIEFIREHRQIPEQEFIFKHALAQEATYESILLQKRRELHSQVGQVMELLFADRLEEFYSLLAYHYAQAESWEKAQDYLIRAGDQAARVAADSEALDHYRRAVGAYGGALGDQWEPLQQASLERKMGEALFRRGDHAQALDYLHRALSCLGESMPRSRWGVRIAIVRGLLREVWRRLFSFRFRRPKTAVTDPTADEVIKSVEVMGWIGAFVDNEQLFLAGLRGLHVSEDSGLASGMCKGFMALGVVSDLFSLVRLAKYYHYRALNLAEKTRHAAAIGLARIGLTLHSICLAAWDSAIQEAQRAATVYKDTGDLHNWGYAIYMIAMASAYQGRFTESLARSDELIGAGKEGADLQVQCWGLGARAFVLRKLGRFDQAGISAREAGELALTAQDHAVAVWAGGEAARSYLRQDRLHEALRVIEATSQFWSEHSHVTLIWVDFHNAAAEVYLTAARQGALEGRKRWLEEAAKACKRALKQGRAFRCVMPEAMRLQGTYRWLRGAERSARRWWRRSVALAEELAQPYDKAKALLEMGMRLGSIDSLSEAEGIFRELGAEWDAATAAKLKNELTTPEDGKVQ